MRIEEIRELEKQLKAPFPANSIDWRISRAGQTNGKTWAFCLAYIDNRSIMNRLDEVFGIAGWKNEYKASPNGGTLCGISIFLNCGWVTKWDGAGDTNFESVKGGLSDSMKRAANQWGIGRYLYSLTEMYAVISEGGKYYQSKDPKGKYPAFKWSPPALPGWALPDGENKSKKPAGDVVTVFALCDNISELEKVKADFDKIRADYTPEELEIIKGEYAKKYKQFKEVTE